MKLRAYAKINWSLDLVGTREDGYHLLDMIMQSIALHDTLTLEPAEDMQMLAEGPVRVPAGADNLVLRAAEALRQQTGCTEGAMIRLRKRIPTGAGLGGGSSDAAAVLKGLNVLWRLGLSPRRLAEIGLALGADIPYCLLGSPCRAQGIGEALTPFSVQRVYQLVVLQPCRALSTRQVFTALAEGQPARHPNTEEVQEALQSGNLTRLSASMGNALQQVAEAFRPEIRQAISALREHGAKAAQMTGSGSAVFGVFSTAAAAQTAWKSLRRKYRVCHLTHTLARP